ncbi:metal-dependent hydrolase [Clavibacter michiganensis]|uniref:M48 family metallopeptidase n=1 Tax=Clavibacter michiganensis TaxID=28447 RepID=UPI000CE7775F|nr:SprT family zinc-dependent metalloprotease [Clavibacter michiganensis]PPF52134.1 metal-dependent hydrolase [Clavibacter michiganensis]
MSTANAYLTVRGLDIDVIRKDIKHLHVGVYPPDGRVRVAAPLGFDDEHIRLAVIQRLSWIWRQRKELQAAERQSLREMVTGESHYVWGLRKRLKVVERPGRGHVEVDGDRLTLYLAPDASVAQRHSYLDRWYREQLRSALPDLINTWEQRLGVTVPKWTIRKMKTKWGSCNRETHHLWFNVELAKKHPDCLEYLVVHELTHYLDGTHGAQFTALMDRNLPDWRRRRDELNGAPLAEEKWTS